MLANLSLPDLTLKRETWDEQIQFRQIFLPNLKIRFEVEKKNSTLYKNVTLIRLKGKKSFTRFLRIFNIFFGYLLINKLQTLFFE